MSSNDWRYGLSHLLTLAVLTAAGTGLGVLAWRALGFEGWTGETAWIQRGAAALAPLLATAFALTVAFDMVQLRTPATHSRAAHSLLTELGLWGMITVVAIGAYASYGPLTGPLLELLARGLYFGAALTYGLVLVPVFIVRALRRLRRSG